MYKSVLDNNLHISYKDFVKWCNDRLKDNLWLSHEAMYCSAARCAVRKRWFFKERYWQQHFENEVVCKAIYPFEFRMKEQQKRKETAMGLINFKDMGLDRYEVLCALYNKSKPLGLGMLFFTPGPLSIEDAHELLDGSEYADYVKGRVIKAKLTEDAESFSPRLYDRDNGEGAALRAVQEYVKQKESV